MFVAELELLENGTIPYTGFDYLRTGRAAGPLVSQPNDVKVAQDSKLDGVDDLLLV